MNKFLFDQVVKHTEDYALLLMDTKGNITFCNKGAQRIKGYSEEELIGRNFRTLYTPDDQERNKPESLLEAARVSGKSKDEGWRMRKDGSFFLADMTLTALFDEQGNLTGFFKILRDITEKKAAEDLLRESEKRFKDLIHNVPGVIYQYEEDVNGQASFSFVSPKLKELFDIEPEDMHLVRDLIHPDDKEAWLRSLKDAWKEERPWHFEGRLLYPDGQIKWWRASHVLSAIGKKRLYNGIMEDVTRETLLEQRVKEQQRQFELFVRHAPAAVSMLDRDMRYLVVSDRWISDYKLEGKQVIGVSHYDLFPWLHNDPERIATHQRCLAGAVESRAQDRVVMDGVVNWIRWEMRPWHKDNNEIGGVMIFSEMITGEVVAQQALEKLNMQLTNSNKDLENFAYVVSHDLQEPLRMVGSFLDLLKEEYGVKLDDNAKSYIAFAVDGAERMKRLIKDLLTFSRISTATPAPFIAQPFPMNQVMDEVLIDMSKQIEERHVQVVVGNLPRIQYDRTQLRQVLQNLLSNAIKYNQSEAPRVEVGCSEEDGDYRICVSDNGIGIAAQYRQKVFEIFQRLHNRKLYEGSGIGLAICKKIVQHHGGDIWVEGNAGGGSVFCFTILKN